MRDAIKRAKEAVAVSEDGWTTFTIHTSDLIALINAAECFDMEDPSHRQSQLIKSCLNDLEEARKFDDKSVDNFDSRTFGVIQKDGSIIRKARHNWHINTAIRTLKRVLEGKLTKGARGVRSKEDDV